MGFSFLSLIGLAVDTIQQATFYGKQAILFLQVGQPQLFLFSSMTMDSTLINSYEKFTYSDVRMAGTPTGGL
jgi:hypothetical protein